MAKTPAVRTLEPLAISVGGTHTTPAASSMQPHQGWQALLTLIFPVPVVLFLAWFVSVPCSWHFINVHSSARYPQPHPHPHLHHLRSIYLPTSSTSFNLTYPVHLSPSRLRDPSAISLWLLCLTIQPSLALFSPTRFPGSVSRGRPTHVHDSTTSNPKKKKKTSR